LCLKTGLGKTVSSLERAKRLGFKKLLIVTIQAVIEDWEEEIWAALDKDSLVYIGTQPQRAKLRAKQDDYEVVVATYETVAELNLKQFDSFIFDECDTYARTETKRWENLRAVFHTTGPLSRKIPVQQLTATPVGNQPISVWPLLWLVHPMLAGTKASFRNRFHNVERQFEKKMCYTRPDGSVHWYKKKIDGKVSLVNKEQLRERLAACLFTFKGSTKLPFEDSERLIAIPMTDQQSEIYEELKENLLAEIGDRKIVKIKDGFSKLTRLLQCAEGLHNFDPDSRESGKLDYLIGVLDRALKRGEKVVVWSRFKPITKILYELYKDHAVLYNGDVSKSRRALAKWSFNGVKSDRQLLRFEQYKVNNPDWLFDPGEAQFFFGIIHSKTSRGMNLQAGAYQLFSSFSFSAYAMEQTKGRLVRIGQKADIVKSRYLHSENTWEQPCLAYTLGKRLDAQALVEGTESVSKHQLIDLINILRAA
jgi:hypothetical protein